jgi:hypothetical protein
MRNTFDNEKSGIVVYRFYIRNTNAQIPLSADKLSENFIGNNVEDLVVNFFVIFA